MFETSQRTFFIGIGGIGTSALARILHGQGNEVLGSDLSRSEITQDLEAEGIKIFYGHSAKNLPDNCKLLVYSPAVPDSNPERKKAKELKIKEMSYPEALGELLKNYGKVIAVAGTNGKTTTTAMIGVILEEAGEDPTVLVGSKVLSWNSNARIGGHKFFVVEADEYRRAFLNYSPDLVVITNIAADHLDYFKDLADIKNAFLEFANKIKRGGVLVYNLDDKNSALIARDLPGSAYWRISLPRPGEGLGERSKIGFKAQNYKLLVPGRFNQANAAAAAAACKALGIAKKAIAKGLQNFTGTWRRFELVGLVGKTKIYSDYAHHPEGLRVTFQMIAETFPEKKCLIVFQPHQHNRTKMLFTDFVKVFCESQLKDFIISEIFEVAGREGEQDQNVSSKDLVREIAKAQKTVEYSPNLLETEKMVRSKLNDYDMIVFMGAGDIYKVANYLVGQSCGIID